MGNEIEHFKEDKSAFSKNTTYSFESENIGASYIDEPKNNHIRIVNFKTNKRQMIGLPFARNVPKNEIKKIIIRRLKREGIKANFKD